MFDVFFYFTENMVVGYNLIQVGKDSLTLHYYIMFL